jgi:hypothetical protein
MLERQPRPPNRIQGGGQCGRHDFLSGVDQHVPLIRPMRSASSAPSGNAAGDVGGQQVPVDLPAPMSANLRCNSRRAQIAPASNPWCAGAPPPAVRPNPAAFAP